MRVPSRNVDRENRGVGARMLAEPQAVAKEVPRAPTEQGGGIRGLCACAIGKHKLF